MFGCPIGTIGCPSWQQGIPSRAEFDVYLYRTNERPSVPLVAHDIPSDEAEFERQLDLEERPIYDWSVIVLNSVIRDFL
jgi:hypothetical protein